MDRKRRSMRRCRAVLVAFMRGECVAFTAQFGRILEFVYAVFEYVLYEEEALSQDSLEIVLLCAVDIHDPDPVVGDVRFDRAPTWSWVSINALVTFPLSSYYMFDHDERGKVTSDRTGGVAGGFVSLSRLAFDCSIKGINCAYAAAQGASEGDYS
ncbi:hypothetical protein GQ53DRAFT_769824 [Thozetella sp. PMI_491]|nr:hypothetical protein GQ53DRAFT_769824 [Thozetella sp. PMI_491]